MKSSGSSYFGLATMVSAPGARAIKTKTATIVCARQVCGRFGLHWRHADIELACRLKRLFGRHVIDFHRVKVVARHQRLAGHELHQYGLHACQGFRQPEDGTRMSARRRSEGDQITQSVNPWT